MEGKNMDSKKFDRFCELLLEKAKQVRDVKGKDYSRKNDRLSNFKIRAEHAGISPMQVWSIYTGKGLDAIDSFVKTGKLESESLDQRFVDAINYLLLGAALIHEEGHCEMVNENDFDEEDQYIRDGVNIDEL
jgi:hypothetical protein